MNSARMAASLAFGLVACGFPIRAGDWQGLVEACHLARETPNRFRIEDCVARLIGLEPVRPAFKSISPGSGLGLGLGLMRHVYSGRVERELSGSAIVSLRRFVFVESRYSLFFPGIGQWDPVTATLKDKVKLSVFASRMELRRQDFYGLGPDATRAGRALYGHRQDNFGIEIHYPLTGWLVAGGTVQALRPRIGGVSDPTVAQARMVYSESGAPGILAQPLFMDYEAYLRVRTPSEPPFNQALSARYAIYRDLDSGRYSFRRLTLGASREFNFLLPMKEEPFSRSGLENSLCQPQRATPYCSIGELTVSGRASLSDHGARNRVPFYLQETLGGTDLYGRDTLRGFADYRYRGPNLVLLQAEARHSVWGPLGVMGFYDLGKVALRRSDLGFAHLRHDIGLGVYFSAANRPILRVYVAFGGEAARPGAKLANAF